jgi:hypothetical protein
MVKVTQLVKKFSYFTEQESLLSSLQQIDTFISEPDESNQNPPILFI